MLDLRPICEHCAAALPPDSTEARICSFECTFCRRCVEGLLGNICPNCGGGFVPRPVRPAHKLGKNPPATAEKHKPVDLAAHAERVRTLAHIPPERR